MGFFFIKSQGFSQLVAKLRKNGMMVLIAYRITMKLCPEIHVLEKTLDWLINTFFQAHTDREFINPKKKHALNERKNLAHWKFAHLNCLDMIIYTQESDTMRYGGEDKVYSIHLRSCLTVNKNWSEHSMSQKKKGIIKII